MPPRDFRLDPASITPLPGSAKLVMDAYAENALEVALQLREKAPGSKVAVLAVADKPADEALKRAFAVTANPSGSGILPGTTSTAAL